MKSRLVITTALVPLWGLWATSAQAMAAIAGVSPVAQTGASASAPSVAKPAAGDAPRPTPKSPTNENAVSEVVVTGAAPDVQTFTDRRSYSLGNDIQATTGSIADALRNVPSVEVDLQGGLTLRGDANVTILVDGKPSGAFEGAGRADALQQMPADQIERVEVITNPSAALNPEGSGGIINLITKKSRGAGWTGSAYVTAGSGGLKRLGAAFGYNSAKLNVTGSLAGNYQRNKTYADEVRSTLDPITGNFRELDTRLIGRNLTRGPTARLSATYTLDPNDQLTGALSYNELLVYGHPFYRYEDVAPNGAVLGFAERLGHRRFEAIDTGVSGGWRHSFAGEGHQLSVDGLANRSRNNEVMLLTIFGSSSPALQPLDLIRNVSTIRHSELKATYTRPLPGEAKLTAGYELKGDDNRYDAGVAHGASRTALTPDPRGAYAFEYRQTLNAAFATYERPFGDLSVQAGLRLEDVRLDIRELTSQQRRRPDYFRAYPTLHLTYALDNERKVRASYSKRVQRPPAFLLNPFLIYADPKTYQQGNPDLQPQETQSFEASYEQRRGPASYLATLYYRQSEDEFTQVAHDLGGGVFVITADNLGSSRSAGLELVANGKLSQTLTYSANTTLFWTQISAANLGFAGDRSAFGLNGRLNLNWQATPDDLLQLNASAQGKRLLAQGEIQPSWTLNFGWRHKVNDAWTATLSVQDLLDTNRNRAELVTPTLRHSMDRRFVSRAISLRLDYRFGGKGRPARDPGFEYENAPPSGP